jgi:hypothetical protein
MGAQWKQAGREASAHKKGQMTVKLVREIMVAAKLGGPDPDLNARLFVAVEKAKKASVYKDTIERAINKGAGIGEEKVNYETVIYEGFAPHKVPVRSGSPGAWHFSSIISVSSKARMRTPIVTRKAMPSNRARRKSSRWNPRKFPRVKRAHGF